MTDSKLLQQISQKDKEPMIKLIRKQLKNSHNAAKRVAEKFFKKNL